MQLEGHVANGHVVLDSATDLPEGTRVRVEVVPTDSISLFERLRPLIGKAQNLPADASLQHDHYLYGTPKKP